ERAMLFSWPEGVTAGPATRPRGTELFLQSGGAKIGVRVFPERTAVLSVAYDGRPACHYCGACGNGCDVRARFSSLDVIIPKLRSRSNFKLQTHAVGYQVLTDKDGRARGVSYIDALTRKDYEVEARSVVLAASTVESGRMMLNSKSKIHPNGLGNSSGMLGHFVMDSTKSGAMVGVVPQLKNRARADEDGAGGSHVTIPRFDYGRKKNYHG